MKFSMTKSAQHIAYKYGMELAARDAGYTTLEVFVKKALAIPGAVISQSTALNTPRS